MTDLPPPSAPQPPEVPAMLPPEVPASPPEVPAEPAASGSSPASGEGGFTDQLLHGIGGDLPKPSTADEKTLGVLMHLLPAVGSLLGMVLPIPGLAALLPVGFWLMKRDSSPYLKAHGQEVVQFAATYSVPALVVFVMAMIPIINFIACIFVPVVMVAHLATVILSILAAIKTSNSESYRYPFVVRFLE